MKIEIGQEFIRLIGGQIPMKVYVESINEEDNTFMVNTKEKAGGIEVPEGEGWTFDIKTGAEIDEDLKWGPQYKQTGSFIKEIVDENKRNSTVC